MTITITTKSSTKAHLARAKALELLKGVKGKFGVTCEHLVSPILGRDPVYTLFVAASNTTDSELIAAKDKLINYAYDDADYNVHVKRWYD